MRICRRGYPNRLPFDEFIQRYRLLAGKDLLNMRSPSTRKEVVGRILRDIGIHSDRYQIGKNKVFCRVGLISEMENKRKEHIQAMIVGLQSWMRWYGAQKYADEKCGEW